MSALGQKQTYAPQQVMSALPPIATQKSRHAEIGHVRFTPQSGHVQCDGLCRLWANSGHCQRDFLSPSWVIFRRNFWPACSVFLDAVSLFLSGHNHIRRGLVCIGQAASAAQHSPGIPFCLAPALLRRLVSRAISGRSAIIRAAAHSEMLSKSEQCLLAFCA